MADPLSFHPKFETLFQEEILTYLNLSDVEILRRVSRSYQTAANKFKAHWIQRLDQRQASVIIDGLQSTKGQLLNGKVVHISGKSVTSSSVRRYPVDLVNWITGEAQTLTIKFSNLLPFATTYHKKNGDTNQSHSSLLEYCNTSRVRRSHGMLLDQILMLARWEANGIDAAYPGDSFPQFYRLPRGHPILQRLNQEFWTWFTIHPELGGYYARGTICDSVAMMLIQQHQQLVANLATEDALWAQD
ncbi:MAG: hypothetical protein SGILL_008488, partial [Bacillariaceae sp.]